MRLRGVTSFDFGSETGGGVLRCRGPPGTYKQTLLTSNKAVIPKLQGVIDHYYSDEKCEQLQFNVTTDPVESHNGELICLYAKREFSADGARCNNYACLVALHGRHADLMLMEMRCWDFQ